MWGSLANPFLNDGRNKALDEPSMMHGVRLSAPHTHGWSNGPDRTYPRETKERTASSVFQHVVLTRT